MRVGLSLTTAFTGDPRQAVARLVEQVEAAHDAGLDSIEVGDHHVHPTGYLQNMPLLGRLAAAWPDRSVLVLALLPLWSPVLLAEQLATLATLTHARISLCAGLGYVSSEFDAFGVPRAKRVPIFERNLGAVRALLDGGTDGTARIAPHLPDVELLVASGVRVGVRRAARLADGWLAPPTLIGSDLTELALAFAQASKLAPASARPRAVLRRDVHVADRDAARRVRAEVEQTGRPDLSTKRLINADEDEMTERFRQFAAAGFAEVSARPIATGQADVLRCIAGLGRVRRTLMAGENVARS